MSVSDFQSRPLCGSESTWCKVVPGGTGTSVLGLLVEKQLDFSLIETALHSLQLRHPLLRSKLKPNADSNVFSFLIPKAPTLKLHPFDSQSTAEIVRQHSGPSSFHILLEHELNCNPWVNPDPSSGTDVLHASIYTLEDGGATKWSLIIRVHSAVCDRTAAVEAMKDLTAMMKEGGGAGVEEGEVIWGLEEYVPDGKTNKPFWARGVDMLGYSFNSFRLANLDFADPGSPRSSRVVRLLMDLKHTTKLLEIIAYLKLILNGSQQIKSKEIVILTQYNIRFKGCKTRGIKLCGALSAAVLMAARLAKRLPDGESEKYSVVTMTDCRKLLQPPLSSRHVGFYHSAILSTHEMKGGEELWDFAKRIYTSFRDAMNSNKHFSDMADFNFLMCKAIENPGLTPSSSLRTSSISVFEDPIVDQNDEVHTGLGIEDYVGCASVHGVGPSIAMFDTIRDGKLDCACVYPFPLHSREQMQALIDKMKTILTDAVK
ncbi:hypothetical protein Cgig2_000295 [Carnegiea gigantea]|uniref:Alcohol acetyltransferase n=1 Tax=Carnegiea gigantea TaxID=171969 RepID=A0A9Q1QBJ1_9CARY|nr:hypothetical protein Cgig2_000295 [Carnegiea gigantea]